MSDTASPTQDWAAQAQELYEAAMFRGDASALDRSDALLDAVEASLCLARGKVLHLRFFSEHLADEQELALFERAATLYHGLADAPGEADALFWVGCYHQVVREDSAAATPFLERSYALASSADDRLTMSYAVRHLGFADWEAGRLDEARDRLTESVRLRREIGFGAGEAAGLVALADLEAEAGNRSAASRHLDAAHAVAEADGADAVLGWVAQARGRVEAPQPNTH